MMLGQEATHGIRRVSCAYCSEVLVDEGQDHVKMKNLRSQRDLVDILESVTSQKRRQLSGSIAVGSTAQAN
jgi:hypothetical protein